MINGRERVQCPSVCDRLLGGCCRPILSGAGCAARRGACTGEVGPGVASHPEDRGPAGAGSSGCRKEEAGSEEGTKEAPMGQAVMLLALQGTQGGTCQRQASLCLLYISSSVTAARQMVHVCRKLANAVRLAPNTLLARAFERRPLQCGTPSCCCECMLHEPQRFHRLQLRDAPRSMQGIANNRTSLTVSPSSDALQLVICL
jgi:hypothetical protein